MIDLDGRQDHESILSQIKLFLVDEVRCLTLLHIASTIPSIGTCFE
jgi:hypothetical protein